MEFVIELEKEFGIYLPDEGIYDMNTPKEFIDFIFKELEEWIYYHYLTELAAAW